MTRTHLITGITGQDGALLARLLLRRGDRVVGTSMSGSAAHTAPLLGGAVVIRQDVRDMAGFERLLDEHRPDTVFNLAAPSSVAASWDTPAQTRAVAQEAVENMLTVLLGRSTPPRFVHASSSEIFGPPREGEAPTHEDTELNPVSPYGEAKAAAHVAVQQARHHGLEAANLVLFGHTSVYQSSGFVLPTIAHQAAEVAAGTRAHIVLQDPSISRDWGSAHDVAAAFADSVDSEARDLVIATGQLHSLGLIAGWALTSLGQDPSRVVSSGATRPNDFGGRVGNAARALEHLGWLPRRTLAEEITDMARTSLGNSAERPL